MKRTLALSLLSAVLFGGLKAAGPTHTLCEGFLPPNDLKIPVGSVEALGLGEAEFNAVLDTAEKVYRPLVESLGGVLVVNRLWTDETVNASAQRSGNKYIINMYGGLARHKTITQDGFALVAAHEMGHHIGGAPKYAGWWNTWASNEGQSDYYANLKGLRKLFTHPSSKGFTRMLGDDPLAVEACGKAFDEAEDKAVCVRGSMAGKSVSELFQILRNEDKAPAFDTPDPAVVTSMKDSHPATQCRMDTYFHGSLCTQPVSGELSQSDPLTGTCNRSTGYAVGIRPLCWYKPAAVKGPELLGVNSRVREVFSTSGSAFSALQKDAVWKGF